jgi:hypothetical protein
MAPGESTEAYAESATTGKNCAARDAGNGGKAHTREPLTKKPLGSTQTRAARAP